MKSVQCGQFGLTNFRSETVCKRCGFAFSEYYSPAPKRVGPRQAARQSSWLYTMLFIAVIGGAAYYLYTGFLRSFDEVNQMDPAHQAGVRPKPQATLSTRSEADQKRMQSVKTAIHNSQGLAESERRMAETQKLMQPAR